MKRKGLINIIKPTFEKFIPKTFFRNGTSLKDEKVWDYHVNIEKVPDKIQYVMEKEGAYLVYFNGAITDHPEMKHAKGKKPRGWTEGSSWDNLRGVYQNKWKSVMMGNMFSKLRDYLGLEDLALHEYGHSYDSNGGNYLIGKPLSKTKIIKEAIKKRPFEKKYFKHPREFVAKIFDMYYSSKESREKLKKEHKIMYHYLKHIENLIVGDLRLRLPEKDFSKTK
jgi:Pro-Pro endopeptidase